MVGMPRFWRQNTECSSSGRAWPSAVFVFASGPVTSGAERRRRRPGKGPAAVRGGRGEGQLCPLHSVSFDAPSSQIQLASGERQKLHSQFGSSDKIHPQRAPDMPRAGATEVFDEWLPWKHSNFELSGAGGHFMWLQLAETLGGNGRKKPSRTRRKRAICTKEFCQKRAEVLGKARKKFRAGLAGEDGTFD